MIVNLMKKSLLYSNRYHWVQQLKIFIFNWFLGRTDYSMDIILQGNKDDGMNNLDYRGKAFFFRHKGKDDCAW